MVDGHKEARNYGEEAVKLNDGFSPTISQCNCCDGEILHNKARFASCRRCASGKSWRIVVQLHVPDGIFLSVVRSSTETCSTRCAGDFNKHCWT